MMFMMSSWLCGKMQETKLYRFFKQQQERLVENKILIVVSLGNGTMDNSFCISAGWLDFPQ